MTSYVLLRRLIVNNEQGPLICTLAPSLRTENIIYANSNPVSLNHDGTDGSDGTGIQSVSPVPSASAAGPSVPSVINSRRKLTNWFANSRKQ